VRHQTTKELTHLPGFSHAPSPGSTSPPLSSTSTGSRSSLASLTNSPQYLTDLLHPYIPSRTLRSSDSGLRSIPPSRLRTFGDRAFSVTAPTLWNSVTPLLSTSSNQPLKLIYSTSPSINNSISPPLTLPFLPPVLFLCFMSCPCMFLCKATLRLWKALYQFKLLLWQQRVH